MTRIQKIFIGLIIAFILVGGGMFINFLSFLKSPILPPDSKPYSFVFAKDSNLKKLTRRLSSDGLIKKPKYFLLLAHLMGDTKSLQAGEYQITNKMRPVDLLRNLAEGKVFLYAFTIIPGTTFKQVVKRFQQRADHGQNWPFWTSARRAVFA